MESKQNTHKNLPLSSNKKKLILIIAVMVLVVAAIVSIIFFTKPERSVASFCRVATQEKTVLVGDVNYERRLESYRKLEAVSPDDIRADIVTIRKGYEEIVKDPSNTLNAGLGMSGAENRRTAYINSNCKDF